MTRFPPPCPFLDHVSKKCMIYLVRPVVCREHICNKPKEQIAEFLFQMQFDTTRYDTLMHSVAFDQKDIQKYIQQLASLPHTELRKRKE